MNLTYVSLEIHYPTLSAIWGQDWMNGSIAFWMTFPFLEVFQMWNVLMSLTLTCKVDAMHNHPPSRVVT